MVKIIKNKINGFIDSLAYIYDGFIPWWYD